MDVYMVVVVVAGGQGGGGGRVFVPTIQTYVKFRNFTNFKTLFSLVSTVLS